MLFKTFLSFQTDILGVDAEGEWEGNTVLSCLFLQPTARFESDSLLGHGNIPTHVSQDGRPPQS